MLVCISWFLWAKSFILCVQSFMSEPFYFIWHDEKQVGIIDSNLIFSSTSVFGVSTKSMQLSFDSRGNSVPTILLMMQRRLYLQGGLEVRDIYILFLIEVFFHMSCAFSVSYYLVLSWYSIYSKYWLIWHFDSKLQV